MGPNGPQMMPTNPHLMNNGTNSPMNGPPHGFPPGHPGHPGHPHPMGPNGPPPPHAMMHPNGNDPSVAPFLQQQNTIFVFTTGLANEAAHACVKGHFRNIIEFHRQLPATNEFLKNIHHQQMLQQQHQGGGPGRPGPNGLPPIMQQNEQLTSEQLKKRTEKLGKLKDISSMICPQDGTGPAAPATKRGKNSAAAAAAAAAAVAAANKPLAGHMMGQPGGPPYMNGPTGPDGMPLYNGGNPNEQFNPMMQAGGPPNPYMMDQKQQEWNRLSKT